MQQNWPVLIALAAFVTVFGGLALVFIAKARKRRLEDYREVPPLLDDDSGAQRDVEQAKPDSKPTDQTKLESKALPELEVEPEPELKLELEAQPEPEAELEPEPESKPEPEQEVPSEPKLAAEQDSEDVEALRSSLKKTNRSFMGRIGALFTNRSTVDDSVLDELEDVLLTADVGVRLVMELVDELRDKVASKSLKSADDVRDALKVRLGEALNQADTSVDPLALNRPGPKVILFVGVNGVGKTTSIGKIAHRLKQNDRSVVLAAGDTFRAAAVEQLKIWGERTTCRVISGEEQSDPASVLFNAVQHAVESRVDFLLADTAGRLHTKSELMDEISKVRRAAGKALDGAPHEVWLVVDGTTGQNALAQAREFNEALGLTGVVLTKLDGTAKGGVVIAIANELQLPVRFVGVGEQAGDLRPFNSDVFLDALFEPC